MTDTSAPQQQEVADFYDESSRFLAEVTGGSLHFGYWTGPSDRSAMGPASQRLTDMMIERVRVGPGDRVLDIGCGTGEPAIRLARATGAQVVGITISAVQVERANAHAAAAGMADLVSFRHADAMKLPFQPDSFDGVWLFESVFHMPNRLEPLRQAAAVLRPGGRLALTDVLDNSGTPERDDLPYASLFGESMRIGDYQALLQRAGLVEIEALDITAHTVPRSLASIHHGIEKRREELVAAYGSRMVEQVEAATTSLEAAGLGYSIVTAERTGGS
ncbi:methyltransferase type 11 [Streptomyces nigrescens]|uniref:Methyltransferase type 11 n=2 Tax=Streptomyces TaxID=1883 RepID=A0ABM7ZXZ6_STRNI|nr:methyltransferase domain-containing protein [Streptomyces nigrescens]MEE4421637.1 methyltransferase domain-containing protein [Streptomyces sp. DSM 41528]BDM71248.1 methyltransferase type 11 [Streptomyces nigrescens]